MSEVTAKTIKVGEGDAQRDIAVLKRDGDGPGILWLGGYSSDMTGTKSEALDHHGAARGLAVTRLDYSGHGASSGAFADGTISQWLEESLAVFDRETSGPQIVVGSSMGGWLALLLAEARRETGRVAGLVLIAPATDMTHDLMWATFDEATRAKMLADGLIDVPGDNPDEGFIITHALVEDGKRHLFGDRLIETGCPVHILQGAADEPVPWEHSAKLVTHLASDDVVMTLVKDGDHRLSRPEDLDRLMAAVDGLIEDGAG